MKTLKDVMTRQVEALSPHISLRLASEVMRRLDVRAVPICEDGTPLGLVTDRDLVVRGLALGRDPDRAPVASVMSREVTCLPQDARVEQVARLMEERALGQVLVVDDHEHVVGIASLEDLQWEASSPPRARTLQHPAAPGRPLH